MKVSFYCQAYDKRSSGLPLVSSSGVFLALMGAFVGGCCFWHLWWPLLAIGHMEICYGIMSKNWTLAKFIRISPQSLWTYRKKSGQTPQKSFNTSRKVCVLDICDLHHIILPTPLWVGIVS